MNFRKLFTFKNKNYRRFKNYDDEYKNSIDEIIIHPNRHSCEPSSSVARVSNISETVDNLPSCLQASNIKSLLNNSNKVLVLKFQTSIKPTTAELDEVSQQCLKKSIVILLTSDDGLSFFLYWKSKNMGHFLSLKIYDGFELMNDAKFFEFLTNFIGCSLNRGHLGLNSNVTVKSGPTSIQLDHLADNRNFNLLQIAAESGNAYIVQFLLTLGFSSEFRQVNAQTLAWKNRHFEVLSLLLKSNLIYPYTIHIDECPNDIQEFYEISRRLNEAIMLRDETTVLRILTHNPEIIHFYNLNNESAPAFALKRRLFDMYKLLISKNILLGPHEKFSAIIEDMKESEREKLREIHYDGSQNLPDNHMYVLMSNSRLGHDTSDSTKKYEIIQKAFETMNQNRFVQIILMIVAASRNFRIIFDFNRDSVEVVDPTADESTDGLFYSENGRIYIGAKKLLDEKTRLDAIGVMAHEFCHYVMCLVYKNCGNPYGSGDKQGEQEFKDISRMCLENAGKEKIVDVVHRGYPPSFHHAELVVRVPHLTMKYFDNPERFGVVRVIYGQLFDAFEGRIYKDLQEALPKIEAKAETEKEKSKRKIRKLRLISGLVGLLAVVGIVCGIIVTYFYSYKPTLKFSDLSREDQIRVQNAPVIYKNISIEFHDLFPGNSTVYDMLTSEDLYQMLGNNPMNFSDPRYIYLDRLIYLNWGNLTSKLRFKFVDSNFYFHGEIQSFKFLNKSYSTILDKLSSAQIQKVLSGEILSVNQMSKNETEFYVERKIFIEYIYEIYFLYMGFLNGRVGNYFCNLRNTTGTADDTFDNFYHDFKGEPYKDQINNIKMIHNYVGFLRCTINDFVVKDQNTSKVTDSLFLHKNYQLSFQDILEATKAKNLSSVFPISADRFAETTVNFKVLPFNIWGMNPPRWIVKIDFRYHREFFETEFTNIDHTENVLKKILGLNSNNEFERNFFIKFFYSGNVIFFWDGYDQMLNDGYDLRNVIILIEHYTKNIQFISTNYNHSTIFRDLFEIFPYSFVPFDTQDQAQFLYEYFLKENIDESKIPSLIQKVQKIIRGSELEQDFNNPLLLRMIASTILVYDSVNIFEIYGKFAEMKIQNLAAENKFSNDFVASSLNEGFSVKKFYQKYALSSLDNLNSVAFLSLKLNAMQINLPNQTQFNEISKMEILNINSPKVYKFVHETFKFYFVAQYLVDNVYNADYEIGQSEADSRLETFYFTAQFKQISDFINSYFQTSNVNHTDSFSPQLSSLLRGKFKNILFNSLKITKTSVGSLLRFFEKDVNLVKALLYNKDGMSLYQATFDYAYLKYTNYLLINRTEIKEFARKYLNKRKFNNFISLKDQKGLIQYFMYCVKQFSNSSENARNFFPGYNLPDYVFDLDYVDVLKPIVANLTKDEIRVLTSSQSLWYPLFRQQTYMSQMVQIEIPYTFYIILWDLLDESMQKNWLMKSLKFILFGDNLTKREIFIPKIEKLFSSSEIYEEFVKLNILHHISFFGAGYVQINVDRFDFTWNFFASHTSDEQQKAILAKSMYIECYTNFRYEDLCYFVPEINILQLSLIDSFKRNNSSFIRRLELYEKYFNRTELQELVLNGSKDFIPLLIVWYKLDICEMYAKFLRNLFMGCQQKLKRFLLTKIEPTKLNLFDLLVSFNDVQGNIEVFRKLTIFNSRNY